MHLPSFFLFPSPFFYQFTLRAFTPAHSPTLKTLDGTVPLYVYDRSSSGSLLCPPITRIYIFAYHQHAIPYACTLPSPSLPLDEPTRFNLSIKPSPTIYPSTISSATLPSCFITSSYCFLCRAHLLSFVRSFFFCCLGCATNLSTAA
jgi:hypothetical protein